MNKAEFQKAWEIAKDVKRDLTMFDTGALFGFGLSDFEPVAVPIEAIARTLRWQALQFNGVWDTVELAACQRLMRYKVTVLH